MAEHEGIGELAKAAAVRLADAKCLLNSGRTGRFRGAMYLAGYAVECSLKVVLIERAQSRTLTQATQHYRILDPSFPSLTTARAHDLGLLFELCRDAAGFPFQSETVKQIGIAMRWKHTWRYLGDSPKPLVAQEQLRAVESICRALN